MDAQRWQQVRALFDRVADLPPADWSQRLATLCPDDAGLREQALALLEADAAVTTRTLRAGAHAPGLLGELLKLGEEDADDSWLSRRLGAWRIVSVLGRGGMGRVYLAERDDGEYRQRAAIKLVRDSVDQAEVVRRFRAERQILAGLQHPNIAGLLDGGVSEDAVPWFALEYVDGVAITDYADRVVLPIRARLQLFLAVCAAVSHAHDRLIVHRDLKPANILVDADGRVKLLDFGVAKLLESDAGGATMAAGYTPEYAAPEQVRGEPPTTAVDVHALGLILFQLLAGRHPFAVGQRSAAAFVHAVLTQEPVRPSLALARTAGDADDGAADAEVLARRRASTLPRLRNQLRGDLDAIVLKALRKEPGQRYASVRELADDVRASLQSRPVAARRGGWRYRADRFLRRHALAVAFAGLALLTLVGGLAAALWQAHEANLQREAAQAETSKARAISSFLGEVFLAANPDYTDGADPRASDLLERGLEKLRARTDLDSASRIQLMVEIAHAYRGLARPDRSLAISGEALATVDHDATPQTVAEVHLSHGENLNAVGDHAAALERFEHADAIVERAGLDDPGLRNRLDVAHAVSLVNLRREEQALPLLQGYFERNQPVALDAIDPVPPVALYSFVLIGLGRLDQAVAVTADAYQRSLSMPDLPLAAQAFYRGAYALALTRSGDHARSESLYREELELKERVHGPGAYQTAVALHNIRGTLRAQERHAEALELALRVLDLCRKHQGEDSLHTVRAMIWAGVSYSENGDHRRAIPMLTEARQRAARPGTPQHPEALRALEQALARSQSAEGQGEPR